MGRKEEAREGQEERVGGGEEEEEEGEPWARRYQQRAGTYAYYVTALEGGGLGGRVGSENFRSTTFGSGIPSGMSCPFTKRIISIEIA